MTANVKRPLTTLVADQMIFRAYVFDTLTLSHSLRLSAYWHRCRCRSSSRSIRIMLRSSWARKRNERARKWEYKMYTQSALINSIGPAEIIYYSHACTHTHNIDPFTETHTHTQHCTQPYKWAACTQSAHSGIQRNVASIRAIFIWKFEFANVRIECAFSCCRRRCRRCHAHHLKFIALNFGNRARRLTFIFASLSLAGEREKRMNSWSTNGNRSCRALSPKQLTIWLESCVVLWPEWANGWDGSGGPAGRKLAHTYIWPGYGINYKACSLAD